MKIKIDFVTNSSSSSFVAMGIHFDLNDLTDEQIDKCKKELSRYDPNFTRKDIYTFRHDIPDIFLHGKDLDLVHSAGPPDDYDYGVNLMIGIPYEKMKADETLEQFKERVSKQLKQSLDVDTKPHHIEACWEDR